MIRRIVLISLVLFLAGCANTDGYLIDRGRDAADIVTAAIGMGLGGGKVRVGPIHTGLLFTADGYGLKGGHFGCLSLWPEDQLEFEFIMVGTDGATYRGCAPDGWRCVPERRHKEYATETTFRHPFISRPLQGKKENIPLSYYTQIEATVGLLWSVKLGFNAGELLDFLLGWTTIDIYDDDLEHRKPKGKAEQPEPCQDNSMIK